MKYTINTIIILFIINCALFSKKAAVETRKQFELQAPNIRIDKYPETFNLKAKGPVELPCGNNCSASELEKYNESQISSLAKKGTWEEYEEKQPMGNGAKYSVLARKGEYINNKREGIWKALYETGEVLKEITYKDGKKNGVEKKFKEDGTQIEEINFLDDLEEGKAWRKNRKGLMVESGTYSKGKKEGEWTIYHASDKDKTDLLKSKASYKLDKRYGRYISYYEDGTTKEAEGEFRSSEFGEWRVGHWTYYYDNGKLESVGDFDSQPETEPGKDKPTITATGGLKSVRIGGWKKYYKNGDIFYDGSFKEGKPDGEWKFYYKGGVVRAKGKMNNEFMMTEGKIYNKNATLWGEGKLLASVIKINEKTDELDSSFTPNYPFTYYKDGNRDLVVTDKKVGGQLMAEMYIGDEKIGEGPISDAVLRTKNGCWSLSGKKVYYLMGKETKGKIAEMNKCI